MLISTIIIFYIVRNPLNPDIPRTNNDGVYLFVESCIEDTLKDGIFFISSRGGYFDLPRTYFKESIPTSYWIYCNDVSPEISLIERELSKYLEEQLHYCTNSKDFKDKKVIFGKKNADIKIRGDTFFVELRMPTTISIENYSELKEDYSLKIYATLLSTSFNISKGILDKVKKNSNNWPLDYLFSLADENDFDISIDSYEERDYLIQLNSRKEENYFFNFAFRLGC